MINIFLSTWCIFLSTWCIFLNSFIFFLSSFSIFLSYFSICIFACFFMLGGWLLLRNSCFGRQFFLFGDFWLYFLWSPRLFEVVIKPEGKSYKYKNNSKSKIHILNVKKNTKWLDVHINCIHNLRQNNIYDNCFIISYTLHSS